MFKTSSSIKRAWSRRWPVAALLAVACWTGSSAFAQVPPPPVEGAPAPLPAEAGAAGCAAAPSGCATCAGFPELPSCTTCGQGCVPGRPCCYPCDADSCLGRFLCGAYCCICCPDPCYDPHWIPMADAAFFSDAARPQTQMRLRWDEGFEFQRPDRGEFFWAREGLRRNQIGFISSCDSQGSPGKGPNCAPRSVDYGQFSLYMEAAAGRAGIFVETPYREVDPNESTVDRLLPTMCCTRSGFADMKAGTKAMLLDCELLQITFQFTTYIPTGSTGRGLGTGHVALEPALLFGLKLSPTDYLQAETAYWISVGGDDLYQSDIFHAHVSWNHLLWRILPNVILVGTAEINEWSVMQGSYTVTDWLFPPAQPIAASATATMASLGPGLRLFICDKIDVGVGTAFAITGDHWEKALIRSEFRWRF